MEYAQLYRLLDDIEGEIIDLGEDPFVPKGIMDCYGAFITGEIRGRKRHPEAKVPEGMLAKIRPVINWYRASLESRL